MNITEKQAIKCFDKAFWAELEGKLSKAIDYYTVAIRLNNQLAHAYFNRGNVYNKLGYTHLAIRDYSQALAIDPHLNGSLAIQVA